MVPLNLIVAKLLPEYLTLSAATPTKLVLVLIERTYCTAYDFFTKRGQSYFAARKEGLFTFLLVAAPT